MPTDQLDLESNFRILFSKDQLSGRPEPLLQFAATGATQLVGRRGRLPFQYATRIINRHGTDRIGKDASSMWHSTLGCPVHSADKLISNPVLTNTL